MGPALGIPSGLNLILAGGPRGGRAWSSRKQAGEILEPVLLLDVNPGPQGFSRSYPPVPPPRPPLALPFDLHL